MSRLLDERRAEGRPCLVYLHGPDGIGRTSLASEFFHEHRSAFDDAYIEVAARQPDGKLVQQGEMLGQALRGLGVADADLASSDAARAEAFQRLSAGKRFLMLITDVASAEQVTRLIPTSSPEAAVVVTARVMLRELFQHDFADVSLSRLPRAESRDLLVACMGPGAAELPAEVIDELTEICDGFPLLIRILGAQLVRRPQRAVERYLRELRASDEALLAMDHSQRVTRFLNATFSLVRDLQLALRRLALLPGPKFGIDAAAVALDVDRDRAEQVLDELSDLNLLVHDTDRDRYSFYRVVRAHALRLAQEVDGPEVVRPAVERITTWYLREAIPRDAALANRWRVGPEFDRYVTTNPAPLPRKDATAWFDVEWASVVACVRAAHEQNLHDIAWQLCVAVFKYLHLHGHVDVWLDSHQLGVRSAEASGNVTGLMQVTSQRGSAHLAAGNTALARQDFEVSLRAAVEAGHRHGEQSAWEWLGKTAAAERDMETAFRCFDESEAVVERSGQAIPEQQRIRMRALLTLHRARAWVKLQSWDRAASLAATAIEHFESAHETDNHAKCLLVLGDAALGTGNPAEAAQHYNQAARLFSGDQTARAEAGALRQLGAALRAGRDFRGAAEALRSAMELYITLGDAEADGVNALLKEVEEEGSGG
ncbi:NB-ARC domain-containing protein [Lentzea kentuckyensis]|uniref:NB-ARC domain-containing protein n=1 Tax=Lentzea kentuckyensis TaxID=360086 RepID=UPI000A38BAE8|nr:NB-ARC domain-containing protein [Lentzea kentuckyensis]